MPNYIPVSGPIQPTSETDVFPICEDKFLKGGFQVVANESERLLITPDRRKIYMEVKQQDTGVIWELYGGIDNVNWRVKPTGGNVEARSITATPNTIPVRDTNGKFQLKIDSGNILVGDNNGNASQVLFPNSLSGQTGKYLVVRPDETGFTLGTVGSVTVDWDSVNNKPAWVGYMPQVSLAGNENKFLSVKADASGYEYKTVSAGSNTQVIFNDNGTLYGDSKLIYDKTTGDLTSSGFKTYTNYLASFGRNACRVTTGNVSQCTFIGDSAGTGVTSGYNSTVVGMNACGNNVTSLGSGNTYLGTASAFKNSGSGNLFMGFTAGKEETTISNKLIIEADNTRNTNKDYLIEGDFSERWVRFNGAIRKRVVNVSASATSLDSGTVTGYLNGVITDSSKNFVVNAYAGKLLVITGGLGVGKVTKINSNTATTISQTTTTICDSTSTYKIIDVIEISNEKFNSEYLIDLSTEDLFIYFNNFPNLTQEINIIINKNPNNKNVWIAGETTNGLRILPYGVIYKSYNTPLKTYTFKSYQQDGSIRGFLETTQDLKQLKPISTTTKDLQIDLNNEIYKLDVATATTVTLNIDSTYVPILTNNALTIELHINMTAASIMTWPVNVSWIGGSAPTFNAISKYCVVLRTMDAGTTWIANLAYTY